MSGLKRIAIFVLTLLIFSASANATANKIKSVKIDHGFTVIEGIPVEVCLTVLDGDGQIIDINCTSIVKINCEKLDVTFINGATSFEYVFKEKSDIIIECDEIVTIKTVNPIPLWFSIIPPLIAILCALIFKEVFSALFLGIFSGSLIIWIYSGAGVFNSFFKAIFSVFDRYVVAALSESTHVSIIIFSMLIGGTVHIITKNGGMQGIINFLSKYARSQRSGQLVTFLLGILIFFDDYANTLVVGNTMRPVTDKLKISREKLAYVVDSTAAPVASIAFVTTWIGAELSYIQSSLINLNLEVSAYNVFFSSLKYSFYPIITLVFVFMLIYMRRDYGSMYKAELRARQKGVTASDQEQKIQCELNEFKVSEKTKARAFNALIPVGIIVFGTIAGLFYTGWDTKIWNDNSIGFLTKLSAIIGKSDSYKALIWASSGGLIIAFVLTTIQKIMSLKEVAESMLNGFKSMLTAILILTLAWSLAGLISDLHTSNFITQVISTTSISTGWLPLITFIVSGLIAFSTGSSWGTMAIMYPLILPATWLLCQQSGLDHEASLAVFSHVTSTVIAGSVFGDHCSPISDTTILSSLASSCNHIQHVRTQLPYALTVALICLIFGTLPVAFGVSVWLIFPLLIFFVWLTIRILGKKYDVN
ncbi:MAG TPA: Na+/H+ antiporter NhaC family protein [Bacteroidales bacterium]|nr:Na+/H+ antiporter NhaC family protein [Bacteroidales bacterium]